MGRIAASEGRIEVAREALQWAFEEEPEYRGHAYDLAEFLERHEGAQAALDVLRRLPEDLPSDDRAHELRARLERNKQ